MSVSVVEITDPQTGKTFFANLATGECSWELPPNARLQPRDPSGVEWWELFDEKHKLPYYYNTSTKQTEWVRPTYGTIIPSSAIGKRLSMTFSGTPVVPTPSSRLDPGSTSSVHNSNGSINNQQRQGGPSTPSRDMGSYNEVGIPTPPKENKGMAGGFGSATGLSASVRELNIGTPPKEPAMGQPLKGGLSTPNLAAAQNARNNGVSGPVMNPDAAQAMNPLNRNNLQATQAMSLPALQSLRKLPTELQMDINQFRIDGFAKKYFGEQRRGIFRRKVPIEKMLVFQKDSLKTPLMQLRPEVQKDALKCFKALQKIMNHKHDLVTHFPEIQYILERGIRVGGLRDEIFVQLCKQLSQNPNSESEFRGWQFMDIVCCTFPPSKNFEYYLKSFIQQHFGSGGPGSKFDTVVRHASSALNRTCKTGPRGRTMTNAEIDQALQAPFRNSVFGDSLEEIMERQVKVSPGLELPRILLFLSEAILGLNGAKAEGIFRVPGDAESVSELRCRIDKDEYNITVSRVNPNVPSSLLKLWLRELSDPLIPAEYYESCIQVGKDSSNAGAELYLPALQLVNSLPEINRKVVHYMIQFLKIIAEPQNQPFTKMNVSNLAMVFAPNFLRCPSDNPATIFENTKFEQAFLRILIVGGK
ncbi:Rho GTPase activation protein [Entophlyctis helioformis]|nr:Rho GTPase activation protein [Entophlyctis helioformis]